MFICHDLIRNIIEYIPLEDLRDFGNASASFAQEICKMGLRVFYNGQIAIDLRENYARVIQYDSGKKDVIRENKITGKSLVDGQPILCCEIYWTGVMNNSA